MDKNSKEYLFESMPIPRAVAQMAIPVVLSSLVTVLYNLADTYFVGRLNDPVQNAAVTLAAPVMLAFNAVNNLFGAGTSSVISRGLGAKEYGRVRSSSSFGFWGALSCAVLFSLICFLLGPQLRTLLGAESSTDHATAQYMFWAVNLGAIPAIMTSVFSQMVRAEGSALHASIGIMTGCLLNMILDPIFIMPWGLSMAAAGAGCATFLSNLVSCIYFFILTVHKKGKTYICLDPRKIYKNRSIIPGIFSVGIPVSVQNILNVVGMTLMNNFMAAYGASAVAAIGIVNRLYSVPTQIVMGAGNGIMPLVGYNYTSGNHLRMKKCIFSALGMAVPIMAMVTIIFQSAAGPLVGAFTPNAEIISCGVRFLRAMSLSLAFQCFDFLCVGVFQALGKGRYALCVAFIRKLLLEIPAMVLLNRLFPLWGIPYAKVITEMSLTIVALVMLFRFLRSLNAKRQKP